MSVSATFKFIFETETGKPTEFIFDGDDYSAPITVTGATADEVDSEIDLHVQSLYVDLKAHNSRAPKGKGIVHTDTELLEVKGAKPADIGF
jgi:hypothetical protein